MSYVAQEKLFLRQLWNMSSRFANPTFLRRLKGILQRCFQGAFYHCLEDHIAKMSKNCLWEMFYISLYEMSVSQLCKISSRFANPTSSRRREDILPGCLFADWDIYIYIYIYIMFIEDFA